MLNLRNLTHVSVHVFNVSACITQTYDWGEAVV